ncbi:magnesium/cobalt transporter CorA [candidate division KSB1 bacterium]|nr:magnesium/cobalt transporter CorA [candidate division KSB1 bacterium]
MRRGIKRRSRKAGLPPGTLVHIGERTGDRTRVRVLAYDENSCTDRELDSIADAAGLLGQSRMLWMNIDAVHDVALMEQVGKLFNLHPLVLEDLVNTDQRPKVEDYGDYAFVVLKQLSYDDAAGEVVSEQVSLILGRNFVLSVGEREGDVFDQVRDRLRNAKGRIRGQSSDYLVYRLLDAVVDHYFLVLEKLGDRIEVLEDRVIGETSAEILREIDRIKREMLFVRRSVWPLREVLTELEHEEYELIDPRTEIYFRDVYDHTIQVIDTVETYRDLLAGMMDLYQSNVNLRLNTVMKVLTVISTIFLPLTFLAGVWGMNFVNMPELYQANGYFVALGFMAVLAVSMVWFFKHKGWM